MSTVAIGAHENGGEGCALTSVLACSLVVGGVVGPGTASGVAGGQASAITGVGGLDVVHSHATSCKLGWLGGAIIGVPGLECGGNTSGLRPPEIGGTLIWISIGGHPSVQTGVGDAPGGGWIGGVTSDGWHGVD